MENREVIDILNDLIRCCTNGEEGFRIAAESIRNSEFRRLFNIFSQQRAQFASELRAEIHRLGGSATLDTATASTGTEPSKSSLKYFTPAADECAVIMQCQQREETAVNSYQEALKADLPLDVQYVVKRQYMDIKDAYDRIRILQRAA